MPRIEPIPTDQLADEPRAIIEDGVAQGLYSTPIPLQIFAYRTEQLLSVHEARTRWGKESLLGGRILELIRIRSAQLGECQPCMQSVKHDSVTDDDVACLLDPDRPHLTGQERMALEFLELLSADHHAMDDDFYRRLAEVFTAAQIIELGFSSAETMGLHRFLHTLDIFGEAEPVIPFSPDQIDAKRDDAPAAAGG